MRIKCRAEGHYCRCQQIRTGDFTVESPWSDPLSYNSSYHLALITFFFNSQTLLQSNYVKKSSEPYAWSNDRKLERRYVVRIKHNFSPFSCLKHYCRAVMLERHTNHIRMILQKSRRRKKEKKCSVFYLTLLDSLRDLGNVYSRAIEFFKFIMMRHERAVYG